MKKIIQLKILGKINLFNKKENGFILFNKLNNLK